MSYLKIDDPIKRDKIVQDFISRKNRIKEEFKRERTRIECRYGSRKIFSTRND